MQGWNHQAVRELAIAYEEQGLGATSSGRFLRELAWSGEPPRGRGIEWLNELLARGVPCVRGELDLLRSLHDKHPSLKGGLWSAIKSLESGETGRGLEDWHREVIATAEKDLAAGWIPCTPELKELIDQMHSYCCGLSSYYWGGRTGIWRRLSYIFDHAKLHDTILKADVDFVASNCGKAWRELEEPSYKRGDLTWLQGERTPYIVVSSPRVQGGGIVYGVSGPNGFKESNLQRMRKRAPKREA